MYTAIQMAYVGSHPLDSHNKCLRVASPVAERRAKTFSPAPRGQGSTDLLCPAPGMPEPPSAGCFSLTAAQAMRGPASAPPGKTNPPGRGQH